jgi:NADH:ubiquinone oxidoreductase subunit F (NADH-binding)
MGSAGWWSWRGHLHGGYRPVLQWDFIRETNPAANACPAAWDTTRMLEILERITEGKGEPGDMELLAELCDTLQQTAMCGLGQTAPNPVLSTLRYFRDEYETHI